MKNRFNLNLVGVLGLFALTATAAFAGGGARVGNGKAETPTTLNSDSGNKAAPAATPDSTPAPTPAPKKE